MKSLFDEFLDGDDPVFQGSKFNFGTDEYDKAYSEQMRAYIDALTTYINAKGLESRCWASIGSMGFNGVTPVNPDAVVHMWSSNWAGFNDMLADGYSFINNSERPLYIVPGTITGFDDYMNVAHVYDTWEATDFCYGYYLPEGHPQLLGTRTFWKEQTVSTSLRRAQIPRGMWRAAPTSSPPMTLRKPCKTPSPTARATATMHCSRVRF